MKSPVEPNSSSLAENLAGKRDRDIAEMKVIEWEMHDRLPGKLKRFIIFISCSSFSCVMIVAGIMLIFSRAAAVPINDSLASITRVVTNPIVETNGFTAHKEIFGVVEAFREVDMSFEFSGRLESLHVEEGDKVVEDQHLAMLDTRAMRAEIDRILAALRVLQSDEELAQINLERMDKLHKTGFSTDGEYDKARLTLNRTIASIEELNAQLVSANLNLEKAVLRAPFDGIVARKYLSPGTSVSLGTPIVQLIANNDPLLRVGMPTDLIAYLDVSTAYTVRNGENFMKARIKSISPNVDPLTRTRDVIFTVVDSRGLRTKNELIFGQLITVLMPIKKTLPGYWVPTSALKENGKGYWSVFVATALNPHQVRSHFSDATSLDNNYDRLYRIDSKIVNLIHSETDQVFVESSFDNNEHVVTDGIHKLVNGQVVRLNFDIRNMVKKHTTAGGTGES